MLEYSDYAPIDIFQKVFHVIKLSEIKELFDLVIRFKLFPNYLLLYISGLFSCRFSIKSTIVSNDRYVEFMPYKYTHDVS